MVGKLSDLKKVSGQTAHELSRPIVIEEIKVKGLDVAEEIAPDICLHVDAEGVPHVNHEIVAGGAEQIKDRDEQHQPEEKGVHAVRQQFVHRVP